MVSCQQKKIGTTKHGASGSNNKSRGKGQGHPVAAVHRFPSGATPNLRHVVPWVWRVSWDKEKTGNVFIQSVTKLHDVTGNETRKTWSCPVSIQFMSKTQWEHGTPHAMSNDCHSKDHPTAAPYDGKSTPFPQRPAPRDPRDPAPAFSILGRSPRLAFPVWKPV